MKYQTYAKYKPSGIEWIGEIPVEWETNRFKFFYRSNMGQTIIAIDLIDDGKYPVLSATEGNQYFGAIDNPSFILNKGDLVVPARGNSIGYVKKISEKCVSTQTTIYCKKVSNKTNTDFIHYYLLNHRQYLFPFTATAIPQITVDEVKENPVVLPDIDTQDKIAEFLDRKTSQIDGLIKKDKRLIELLQERRIALINQAVTKGLDPKARLVDSGVDWIGEIPEGWEVRKLRQCFNLIGSGTTPDSQNEKYYIDGDTPWLITGDLNDGILDDTSKKITKEAVRSFSALKIFPKNSLVIAMYGATIGKVALTTFKTTTNQACCVLNNSDSFDMKFVYYWFIANKNEIISLSYGGGQPNISQDLIKNIKIQVPPLDIQKEIILYLDTKLELMSKHASVVSERIRFLEEYKKSLIYNAVTGKIKV